MSEEELIARAAAPGLLSDADLAAVLLAAELRDLRDGRRGLLRPASVVTEEEMAWLCKRAAGAGFEPQARARAAVE